MKEIFSLNLKALRGERTQLQIADLAGIQLRQYQRLEAGAVPRKRHYVTALAKAHNVKETRLFLDPSAIPKPTPEDALKILAEAIKRPPSRVPDDIQSLLERVSDWEALRDLLAGMLDPDLDPPPERLPEKEK